MKFETLELDETSCFIDNKLVSLTKTEHKLLTYLLNNRDKIHTREKLISEVWKKNVIERTVDTTISRLRNKLDKYKKHLVSSSGFGYGFKSEIYNGK